MSRKVRESDLPRVQLDLDAPPPPPVPDAELRARLGAAERMAQALFDDSPVPIVLLDAEHRLLRANAAFCALVGRSPEELLGVDSLELRNVGAQPVPHLPGHISQRPA